MTCLLIAIIIGAEAQEDDVTYSLGGNAQVGSENDSDEGLPAEGLVPDASYHLQLSYKFPTKKESSWVPFINSVQQYVSIRALQFRSHIEGNEGYDWIESLNAVGLVYGQRYFLRDDFQGLNIGWYLGGALFNTDGYEWDHPTGGDFFFAPYEETFVAPLYAIELNYHFEYKMLFVEPTYSFYLNKDSGDFEGFPSIIIGLQITE